MAGRIVLFGATGYTGRLAAESLVARGRSPVLAGRDADRLRGLADELGGGLATVVADVETPASVGALVDAGDVLLTTVGPFAKWGHAAAEAAIARGAHYVDSTGEPPFIRRVFEEYGPRAERAGVGMLTAFGYDWVPGNLAGGLVLRDAGPAATRVDVGYFVTGRGAFSGGTKASVAGVVAEPAFAFRDGGLRTVRGADRVRSFEVRGRARSAVATGASEHFALPRLAPGLREVNAYLGWFGPLSRPLQATSAVSAAAIRLPGARRLWGAATDRLLPGSTGGPSAERRARSASLILAEAYAADGRRLSEVRLTGVDAYSFTGGMLAWAADRAAAGALLGTGALGPVDGFGLDELESGARDAGIAVSPPAGSGSPPSAGSGSKR